MQGTLLDQQRSHRAAALVKLRLNYQASGAPVRIRLQFHDVCGKQNHLQKVIDALVRLRGYRNHRRASAPVFGDQLILRQLLLDAVDVGARLINLVDCDNDLNSRSLRVIDCFHGLRHDAVIRRDHQNSDIC